ncbi:ribonucleotide-diphosphate reductase subunit beta [Lyticum sinuosum]|uniref:Ribonucleoside-diphosphate reductase subunit beta n=1 Tax=Lyticum sinuosum TaxID=1332059 RepID=A0AAE4VLX8_9RICK|nr:ribonucleotide-diphosphate reductase subunit beta [Lyticum sinuosum]MDZ5761276.1 Ribonucleoside-diphosphate reductase subunit beta [Lyticum sinuosum]
MGLTTNRTSYKPFEYPWAFEAWKIQQSLHWLADEVPMGDDVKDWHHNLNDKEKNLLTQIFRFFTQADIDVSSCYLDNYLTLFRAPEVRMMLTAFANFETIHIDAYSRLLDTIGMPEVEYQAFLKYKAMKDKHDYMSNFNINNPYEIAKTMAAYGAFAEGLQLFASFAMLLNFQRFGKMKGMGQIVAWSVRDETLHTNSIIKLFHTYVAENRSNININTLNSELVEICQKVIELEDAFIDLAFGISDGDIKGMTSDDIKNYIRFIANKRLSDLNAPLIYEIKQNPLPWMDEILNAPSLANFFEARVTEYSKASTQGDWESVF